MYFLCAYFRGWKRKEIICQSKMVVMCLLDEAQTIAFHSVRGVLYFRLNQLSFFMAVVTISFGQKAKL